MAQDLQISYLVEYPEFIPTLGQWLLDYYGEMIGEKSIDARVAKLSTHLNRDKLPIAWVAHNNGEVLGTAALREQELEDRKDQSPWLGGLIVGDQYRRQGIGARLITVVENGARSLGNRTIYLFTIDRHEWYTRLGWHILEPCIWFSRPGNIMIKYL